MIKMSNETALICSKVAELHLEELKKYEKVII
jgi:hypothetical protein